MIRTLRKKFVLVTTTLMVTIFGIIFGAYNLYSNYWDDKETAFLMSWIAENDILFSQNGMDSQKEDFVWDMVVYDNPIVGVIVNKEGEILSHQAIGKGHSNQIPADILQKIIRSSSKQYKVKNYVFHKNTTTEGNIMIIAIDTKFYGNNVWKTLGTVCLILFAIIILILITFYLSRFVTEPARLALLREKQFVSDASHELKTPLSAITINLQALDMQGLSNPYIKNVLNEANRMNRLIERLLTLSKLDENHELEKNNFSISEVCEGMVLTYESVAYEAKVSFTYDIEENISMNGNEDEVKQLIAILLDNAIKNCNEGGTIYVSCRKEKNTTSLLFKNSGMGISLEDLPHIFERFYTNDSSRNRCSFGLGLAIAKSIVDRHNGKIDVVSEPEKDTIFTISLPEK